MSSLAFSFFITESLSILWVFPPILNSQSCNYSSSSRYRSIPLCPSRTHSVPWLLTAAWCLILLILPLFFNSSAFHFSPSTICHSSVPSVHPSCATFLTLYYVCLVSGFQILRFTPWSKASYMRKVCDILHLSFVIILDVFSCICLYPFHAVFLNACSYCSFGWSLFFFS